MNETQLQNRLFDLRIIEAKYSQILEEFEARVDSKLEQYIKHKVIFCKIYNILSTGCFKKQVTTLNID